VGALVLAVLLLLRRRWHPNAAGKQAGGGGNGSAIGDSVLNAHLLEAGDSDGGDSSSTTSTSTSTTSSAASARFPTDTVPQATTAAEPGDGEPPRALPPPPPPPPPSPPPAPLLLPPQEAPPAQTYAIEQLEAATGGFSASRLLGEGTFGSVFRGVLEAAGGDVAIKMLKPGMLGGGRKKLGPKLTFENEACALGKCRHPNVVTLLGHCYDDAQARVRRLFRRAAAQSPPRHCLVFEFMPGGPLDDRLASPVQPPLLWQERHCVASDVARALHFLHREVQPPIIHQDVKSANILLDTSRGGLVAKLADFGMARFSPELLTRAHQTTEQVVGTPIYMPMELIMKGHVSEKTDTYALSVVLLELLTGKAPNSLDPNGNDYDMLEDPARMLPATIDERAAWPWPGGASTETCHAVQLARIASRCNRARVRDRCTATDVLEELDALAGR
jgi:hypothetical protein